MIKAMVVMLLIGGVLGGVLAVASRFFHVEVDEREERVTGMLPGYNCGACGFPGCSGLARSIVSGETVVMPCKVLKKDQAEAIAKYLAETKDPNGNTITLKI